MRTFTAFVSGFILAGTLTVGWINYNRPYCPQEDSCRIDYRHGEWHITEVTP